MPPINPKIYHIVHVDRLPSIVDGQNLWSDAEIASRTPGGTVIGMSHIKARRLVYELSSHPALHVGECVPFYFCPRSVMLYMIHMANSPDLAYRGGQTPIVHLEADLNRAVAWANRNGRRWAFTLGNAGSRTFEDRSDLNQLDEVDWDAVESRDWRQPDIKEHKQAEFLVERSFPWNLVERIGVCAPSTGTAALNALPGSGHKPPVELMPDWYY